MRPMISHVVIHLCFIKFQRDTHGDTKKQGLTAVKNQALKDCATKRPLSIYKLLPCH